ncbi:penicillin acylase family protein [Sphingomonas sp.]|uniref:penicillin acylase family protein n=1 Tax=Sphingomonas sp. TaxID=28214 RepID=UPI003CC6B424
MIGKITTAALAFAALGAAPAPSAEMARWRTEAARVTITRDDWGIAHVHGHSDADAAFGAIYAQAEDDFPRIEANYLTALGRTAEAEGAGPDAIWADLRQRLWIDPIDLHRQYATAPAWLRALCRGWADGLNFYLATHPAEHPRVLARFEPWMALSFSEGSIGGDIEKVDLAGLRAFYGSGDPASHSLSRRATVPDEEPRGSNGIAIGPRLSASRHAMLLINPHTSFFFRSELEMESDAGLHAYGASTWGQFFLYQGFNERLGWMHTTSGADNVDEFAETVVQPSAGGPTYRFGSAELPIELAPVTLRVRQADGSLVAQTWQTFRTRHGPIVRSENGKWIAAALMNRPLAALEQSWLRTKARTQAAFLRALALQANSSNNTVYADADGHIALLAPQFTPRRDDRFDYRAPVDGSDPATAWRGVTPMAQLPQVRDPAGDWLYNSNDAPWRAAGTDSPRRDAFPRYMDQAGPNPRGAHATALLGRARALTPTGLRAIAYDPWSPEFTRMVPKLLAAWDRLPDGARKAALAQPVAALRGWDARWAADSVPTALAMTWGMDLWGHTPPAAPGAPAEVDTRWARMEAMPDAALLAALDRAMATLTHDFGRWRVPWGEINRFQRNDAAIVQHFDDARPSTPVPFTSAIWGSLASFGARPYPGTARWYGTSGNSFVAIVEFGPRVRAWSVTAGGESGRPGSPHFRDQTGRYAAGDLKPVYFWPDELAGHVERRYRPGE